MPLRHVDSAVHGAADELVGDLAEEAFDEVESVHAGWGEVQVQPGIAEPPPFHRWAFVLRSCPGRDRRRQPARSAASSTLALQIDYEPAPSGQAA